MKTKRFLSAGLAILLGLSQVAQSSNNDLLFQGRYTPSSAAAGVAGVYRTLGTFYSGTGLWTVGNISVGNMVILDGAGSINFPGTVQRYTVTNILSTSPLIMDLRSERSTPISPNEFAGAAGLIGAVSTAAGILAIPSPANDTFSRYLHDGAININGFDKIDAITGGGGLGSVTLSGTTAKGLSIIAGSSSTATWGNMQTPVVFVAPAGTGNDANDGRTLSAPVLTSTRALALAGKTGRIVLKGGDYTNLSFAIGDAEALNFSVENYKRARVFLGEQVAAGASNFTQVGATNIWTSTVATAIPADSVGFPRNRSWVFEQDTRELPIAAGDGLPQQKGRTHRLAHYRLTPSTGTAAMTAGSYFFSSPNLYVWRTDSANPNSTGSGVWIPSLTAKFISGSTNGTTEVEVDGVEVLYGSIGFDGYAMRGMRLKNCTTYGNRYFGAQYRVTDFGEEYNNEHAANGEDGVNILGWAGGTGEQQRSGKLLVWNNWLVGNGDQGLTCHSQSDLSVWNSLAENNGNGGFLGGGTGQLTANGFYTRNNQTAGIAFFDFAFPGSLGTYADLSNCISINDAVGVSVAASTSASNIITLRNSGIYNSTSASLVANSGATILSYDTDISGTAPLSSGAGTITFKNGGRNGRFEVTGPMVSSVGPLSLRVSNTDVSGFHSAQTYFSSTTGGPQNYTQFAGLGVIPASTAAGAAPLYTRFSSLASEYHGIMVGAKETAFYANGNVELFGGNLVVSGSAAINGGGITTTAGVLALNKPLQLPPYPTGGLPAASSAARSLVANTTTGTPYYSDGTAWADLGSAGAAVSYASMQNAGGTVAQLVNSPGGAPNIVGGNVSTAAPWVLGNQAGGITLIRENSLVVPSTGKYLLNWSADVAADQADFFVVRPYVYDGPNPGGAYISSGISYQHVQTNSASATVPAPTANMSATTILNLTTANSTVALAISNSANSTSILVEQGSMTLMRLGP